VKIEIIPILPFPLRQSGRRKIGDRCFLHKILQIPQLRTVIFAAFAMGDLTTAAKSEKRPFWRNNSPCLLRRGVAQQQLRENCCGNGKRQY
jgi:hypothetical protein